MDCWQEVPAWPMVGFLNCLTVFSFCSFCFLTCVLTFFFLDGLCSWSLTWVSLPTWLTLMTWCIPVAICCTNLPTMLCWSFCCKNILCKPWSPTWQPFVELKMRFLLMVYNMEVDIALHLTVKGMHENEKGARFLKVLPLGSAAMLLGANLQMCLWCASKRWSDWHLRIILGSQLKLTACHLQSGASRKGWRLLRRSLRVWWMVQLCNRLSTAWTLWSLTCRLRLIGFKHLGIWSACGNPIRQNPYFLLWHCSRSINSQSCLSYFSKTVRCSSMKK